MFISKKIKNFKDNLSNNQLVKKIVNNSFWLVGDKVFTMIFSIIITSLVARYFGPDNFGLFNYALSFVTLFTAFSTLGLETFVVKAIVEGEDSEGKILCTSMSISAIGGLALVLLSIVIIYLIEPNNEVLHVLVFILSLTMIFKSLEVIEYWIQAYHLAKLSTTVRVLTFMVIALLKVLMIVYKGSVVHYAIIHLINVIIIGLGLIIVYFRNRSVITKWFFSLTFAKNILKKSWFLIISGLIVTLYMQIDKIMLGMYFTSKTELGVYSASAHIASMWYFVPMAIIVSFKPTILRMKNENSNNFLKTIQVQYTVVVMMGLFFGIVISLLSGPIVYLIYGPQYQKAASILIISIWAGTFALLGSARQVWIISENLQKFEIYYVAVGAVVNIILNAFLIPKIGGFGAAIATLISQIVVAIIVPFLFKETRLSSIMLLRAFKFEGISDFFKQK